MQAFQEFKRPDYIITNGGPRNATTLISVIVYNTAFKDYKVGMSSADGVGHVRDRDGVDGDRLCQPEEVGLLFRRRWEGLRDELIGIVFLVLSIVLLGLGFYGASVDVVSAVGLAESIGQMKNFYFLPSAA